MYTIKSLLLLALLLLMSGCGAKIPFTAQKPLQDASLVYLYVSNTQSSSDYAMEDANYKIQINDKNVKGMIKAGEYKVFDMKPGTVLFSVIRREIESLDLKLHLTAGKTYYLKTQSGEFGGKFIFEEVNPSVALNDLKENTLAGSFLKDMTKYIPDYADSTVVKDINATIPSLTEAQIDAIIEKKLAASKTLKNKSSYLESRTQSTSVTSSKLDDIRNAYEMKKQGLLSEEEFKAMKAEILTK